MKIKVKLELSSYGSSYIPKNDEFSLCAKDFRQYFNIGEVKTIDLVISHTKPRSPACYQLSPQDDFWCFTDCSRLVKGDNSPWAFGFDWFLDDVFDRDRPVYVSAEI